MSTHDDLVEQIRQILAKGCYQEVFDRLPYESKAHEIAAAIAPEIDRWRHRFCPAGNHYKGSGTQSRFDPATRSFTMSTFETYNCSACRRDQRMTECAHDGDIKPQRMAFGYGWACSLCDRYFGHLDAEHDEALRLIRAEIADAS